MVPHYEYIPSDTSSCEIWGCDTFFVTADHYILLRSQQLLI